MSDNAAALHVAPLGRTGMWMVHEGDPGAPLSEHASETAAEVAARIQARLTGVERVVVHDRYHRTREIRIPRAREEVGAV